MTFLMEYKLIKLVVQDAIATITLNRPDKRNAMSDDMRTEFITALEHVNATKAIKALVITGEGKGFCAVCGSASVLDGHDIGPARTGLRQYLRDFGRERRHFLAGHQHHLHHHED